jgi:predicted nucleotidyltransferase
MTNISFNLSGKIDTILVSILRIVKERADSLGIPFFIVGAMARDLILEHCHAIKPRRMTTDLDIGIEVAGWDEFSRLKGALLSQEGFSPTKDQYKVLYWGLELDIVPFGAISEDKRTISWPPDGAMIMNIMGFQEAFEACHFVQLSGDPLLVVSLPTVAGMALMKLVSWNDRYPERPKDAEDLIFLMENYAEAGNENRLYEEEVSLLQDEGFDQTLAGIRLLVRDMAALASKATAEAISAILGAETGIQQRYRLVQDMGRGARIHDRSTDLLAKVEKLKQGFAERYQGSKE